MLERKQQETATEKMAGIASSSKDRIEKLGGADAAKTTHLPPAVSPICTPNAVEDFHSGDKKVDGLVHEMTNSYHTLKAASLSAKTRAESLRKAQARLAALLGRPGPADWEERKVAPQSMGVHDFSSTEKLAGISRISNASPSDSLAIYSGNVTSRFAGELQNSLRESSGNGDNPQGYSATSASHILNGPSPVLPATRKNLQVDFEEQAGKGGKPLPATVPVEEMEEKQIEEAVWKELEAALPAIIPLANTEMSSASSETGSESGMKSKRRSPVETSAENASATEDAKESNSFSAGAPPELVAREVGNPEGNLTTSNGRSSGGRQAHGEPKGFNGEWTVTRCSDPVTTIPLEGEAGVLHAFKLVNGSDSGSLNTGLTRSPSSGSGTITTGRTCSPGRTVSAQGSFKSSRARYNQAGSWSNSSGSSRGWGRGQFKLQRDWQMVVAGLVLFLVLLHLSNLVGIKHGSVQGTLTAMRDAAAAQYEARRASLSAQVPAASSPLTGSASVDPRPNDSQAPQTGKADATGMRSRRSTSGAETQSFGLGPGSSASAKGGSASGSARTTGPMVTETSRGEEAKTLSGEELCSGAWTQGGRNRCLRADAEAKAKSDARQKKQAAAAATAAAAAKGKGGCKQEVARPSADAVRLWTTFT